MSIQRKAPDFSLPDADGKTVTLQSALDGQPAVFVFYPGDFTPVCTKQLCSYRDAFSEFENLGIRIIGISADSPEKHRKFRDQYKFAFPLLSDEDKSVARAFGATSKWLLGAVTRANFIVNARGDIVHEHIDAVPVTHQKSESLQETIQALRASGKI